ncbi:MAG: energy transducer TonB [Bacteroidales bacterium]
MKTHIITMLLALLTFTGFSQNSGYKYTGRFTPVIKKDKLNYARSVDEIMPEFNRYFALPAKDRTMMNYLVNTPDSLQVYSAFPEENFTKFIDYVSVNISATCYGKAFTSESTGEMLTPEQKNIINTTDLGTDLHIKIKFSYKNGANNSPDNAGKIIEGEYTVTVVPDTEAEYPGGSKQITAYLTDNIINEIHRKGTYDKIMQAVVNFTVNEDGDVVDTKISTTSTDPKIDKIILDAMNRMPGWRPAENPKGIRVKQVFSIPFGGGGC